MADRKVIVEVLYIGFGHYDPNVPMRDLTASEWLALDADLRKDVLRRNLYQVVYEGGADGKDAVVDPTQGDPGGAGGTQEGTDGKPPGELGDGGAVGVDGDGRDTGQVPKRRGRG